MCSALSVLFTRRALLSAWCSLDVLCYQHDAALGYSALGMLYSYVLSFDVARLWCSYYLHGTRC